MRQTPTFSLRADFPCRASVSQHHLDPCVSLGQLNTHSLLYRRGDGHDGGLKIIRGSHLHRDPTACRADNGNMGIEGQDAAMEAGWLAGKTNPVTGEPLAITKLDLPPGSVVFCLQHAAHGVDPHAARRDPRLCLLLAVRKADESSGKAYRRYGRKPSAIPPVWAGLAKEGRLPAELAELLCPAVD